MPVTLQHVVDNIYRMDISGRLQKRDLDAIHASAAAEIHRAGRIRLFVVLTQFDGWEDGANWRDLSFYVRHGDDIERIAIVGDRRWRSDALMFAGADLRKGAVAFFPAGSGPEARAWLGQ